ncbi:MAG: hypothetical protein NVS9B2_01030 [Steroidobacteraceae bacterium]
MMIGFTGAASAASEFNQRGNLVIADQFNNRIVEIDPQSHHVIWMFGDGSAVPGPRQVVGPNDAERFGRWTLISGSGIPAANPPLPGCPDALNGCPDNRVFIVDQNGDIGWQYGQAGVSGFGPNQLNTPVHAVMLPGFAHHSGPHVMITDQGNSRVIVVNLEGDIVWQYGTTGTPGKAPNHLNNPNSAEMLPNRHILIADENNNRVIEVTVGKALVRTFSAGNSVSGAAFASRLPNGHTLITDSNNNRAVEVDENDSVVWEYVTNAMHASNPLPLPTRAIRLSNGNTLISDQFNNRVIEVTRDKKIVFQQGKLNVAGKGFNRLNGPYDAKRVGDFTGLTPPFNEYDGAED